MKAHFPVLGLVAAAMLLVPQNSLDAGEITGFAWSSGVASIAGISVPPPVDPNNDNVVDASPNQIEILQKDYTGIGPIDIEFTVIPSGGTTEYSFVEGVQNSTGIPWNGYFMQLGFGVGDEFVPSDSGDDLDFDSPDYDSPFLFDPYGGSPFPDVVVGEDVVEATGGVQTGYAEPYVFTIDVPDGITAFTLRQMPVPVPEPTALASGLMIVGCGIARRRR